MKKYQFHILFLILIAGTFADAAPVAAPQFGPIPTPVHPNPPTIDLPKSALCRKTCSGSSFQATFLEFSSSNQAMNCPDKVDLSISCGNYICDSRAKTCKTACDSAADCANGLPCLNGQCQAVSYFCRPDDLSSVFGTDGSRGDCGGLICEAGRCRTSCATTNHCMPGFTCDTSNGQCVRTG